MLSTMMTTALVTSTAAIFLTGAGATAARNAARVAPSSAHGGPYRSAAIAQRRHAENARPGERLVAAGSALLACASAPVLLGALLSLKWEGIGVTLLPALLVVAARLYASLVTFRGGDLGPSRTIAHASLLLDVPLFVFSLVHMHLIEDGASHASLSLAAVAGCFALADGLQAALVLVVPLARDNPLERSSD